MNRLVTAALFFIFALSASHAQLNSGPIVGHTTDTSAIIWAYAGSGKTVELRWGTAGTASESMEKMNMPPQSANHNISLETINGLSANTKYDYEVRVGGSKAGGGSFTTAPIQFKPAKFSYLLASCTDWHQEPTQSAWTDILKQNPVFTIQNGDNVYANSTDREKLWTEHLKQREISNFAEVLATTPTWANWDDHDYGPNDSHKGEPGKANSLKAFKELWANAYYGTDKIDGVFSDYYWGDVHFIILDGRYYRDSQKTSNASNTQFGDAQLEWLYEKLRNSRGLFKVLITGFDVMATAYPQEPNRIYAQMKKDKIYGVLWHTGDIHKNAFKEQDRGGDYKVTQITSSGVAKNPPYEFGMIDVNTTIPDPTLEARFFDGGKIEVIDGNRVIKLSELTPAGVSDVLLSAPNGGQSLKGGETYEITWTKVGTGISNVKLEYSTGSAWTAIEASTANTGKYNWTVPNIPSKTAKIRVSNATGSEQSESFSPFEITAGSPIKENTIPLVSKELYIQGIFAQKINIPLYVEKLSIYNMQGSLVAKVAVEQAKISWNGKMSNQNEAPSGMYMLKTKEGFVSTFMKK